MKILWCESHRMRLMDPEHVRLVSCKIVTKEIHVVG